LGLDSGRPIRLSTAIKHLDCAPSSLSKQLPDFISSEATQSCRGAKLCFSYQLRIPRLAVLCNSLRYLYSHYRSMNRIRKPCAHLQLPKSISPSPSAQPAQCGEPVQDHIHPTITQCLTLHLPPSAHQSSSIRCEFDRKLLNHPPHLNPCTRQAIPKKAAR
jgi:hypothetical protein